MVADSAPASPGSSAAHEQPRRGEGAASRSLQVQRLLAFLLAAGLMLVYALRGGGSYDIVVFEEHGLVLWLLLGLGIACGLLPRSRPSRGQLLFLGALLAYAAWTAVSLMWTSSSERTFEELARSLDYLGLVALLSAVVDRTTWRAAGAGLAFGALFVCVIAVGSRLAPSVFGHDHIDAVLHVDRMSYPFGYWNAVAAWGAMCTAIGLAWSSHDASRWRRAAALALVPVAVITTYLTYSRAGVAGIGLAVIAVIALSRSRLTTVAHAIVAAGGAALAILAIRGAPQIARATGTHGAATVLAALAFAAAACAAFAILTHATELDERRLPRGLVRVLATAGGLVVLLSAGVFGPHLARSAWHSFTRTPVVQSTVNPTVRLTSLSGTRYLVWKSALKAFEAHPVGGLGAGTFGFWWNQHATDAESVLDVHNIWLQNLAELGVPGLLLIIGFAASAIGIAVAVRRRARRATSAGVAAAFSAALLVYLLHASVDWMWESTAVTVLALAGIAIIGARLGRGRLALAFPTRAALALIAALAAVAQLPGLLSTTDIRNSQAAARSGNEALALSWAQDAVGVEPWSASAYEQRGLVLESAGQLREASDDLRRAISEEPLNYEHWLILARIETESGHITAAQRYYDRARSLAPRAEVFSLAPYLKGAPAGT